MRTIAHLQELGGWLFLRSGGNLIDDPRVLEDIAKRLKQTARYLREQSSISGLQAAIIQAEGYCNNISWIFPKRKRDYRGLTSCVYFLTMQNRPKLIKIGCTTRSLTERAGQISYEFKGRYEIRAILCTPHPHKMEQYFHFIFADHLADRREWFALSPVARYLRSAKRLSEQSDIGQEIING